MKKRIIIALFIFTLISISSASADETLTITTYYPSPYGSYNQLTATGNTYLATTSGSVGIGTTGPYAKLHVSDSKTDTAALSTSTGFIQKISNTNNTTGNYSLINFSFPNNDINALIGARLQNSADGSADLVFGTRNGGTLSEAMRIQYNGNVGIGTTAPGNKLHVVGGIRVTTLAAASATTVCRDGSSDLSTCSSSRKFKEGIEYLKPSEEQGILQNIKDTNIARFKMKTENSNVRHIGIIAEESPKPLQFIDEHNNQNIDLLSAQLGYTWAAIKALDRQIGELQSENKQLKTKISLLESKLKRK